MFTLSEFELIREHCPNEMKELLQNLGVSNLKWDNLLANTAKVDGYITQKVCELMKSASVIEGYMMLLDAAKIPYSYSDTQSELLAKIAANRAVIESALTSRPSSSQYEDKFTVTRLECKSLKGEMLRKIASLEAIVNNGARGTQMLKDFVSGLPDEVYTLSRNTKEYTGEGFLRALRGEYQGVPVKVSASRPELRLESQFRQDEASRMLDVLEQLHSIRRKI